MHDYVGRKVKVVYHDMNADRQYEIPRGYIEDYIGTVGIIVDVSDKHGLCYGVVFPSRDVKCLHIYWFEPIEISFI